jgi:peptide/nickel transport system substrate-binding protein/oligopeptide transport system substrate-binding protein
LLAQRLVADFATIGVELERVEPGAAADLRLVDEVARYPALSWYFNQLNCKLRQPCSPEADDLAAQAMGPRPMRPRRSTPPALCGGGKCCAGGQCFHPAGAPLRWSLAAPGLPGFSANPGGVHPLYPLAARSR